MKKNCKKLQNVTTNKVKNSSLKTVHQTSQENKNTTEILRNLRQNGNNNVVENEVAKNNKTQPVKITDYSPTSNNETEPDNFNFQFKGSFQGPIYYPDEIPEPKYRNNIVQSKISKLEMYLSLCEELYLGSYSKSRSTSNLFQYLITSHNINSEEKLDSITKKHVTGNSKSSSKLNQKHNSSAEPVLNAESIISPLDLLTHPLRNKDIIDLWGPCEVVLFECAMCKYGKEFDKIQRVIKTKSTKEIVDFYYCIWKRTSRYRAWKENRQFSENIFS